MSIRGTQNKRDDTQLRQPSSHPWTGNLRVKCLQGGALVSGVVLEHYGITLDARSCKRSVGRVRVKDEAVPERADHVLDAVICSDVTIGKARFGKSVVRVEERVL